MFIRLILSVFVIVTLLSAVTEAQSTFNRRSFLFSHADFNGDGKDDIGGFDGIKQVLSSLSTGIGFNDIDIWTADFKMEWRDKNIITGDFNGDGLDDIGGFNGDREWRFAMSTGINFEMPDVWNYAWQPGWENFYIFTGDFNGDGMCDIGGFDLDRSWNFAISTGKGFHMPDVWNHAWQPGWENWYVFVGDFNADGKDDVGGYDGDREWRFAISTGKDLEVLDIWNTQWKLEWDQMYIFSGDFNGDGYADIGAFNGDREWKFAINNERGFEIPEVWNIPWDPGWNGWYIFVGDFNGDGKDDIGGYNSQGEWQFAFATGGRWEILDHWNLQWNLGW